MRFMVDVNGKDAAEHQREQVPLIDMSFALLLSATHMVALTALSCTSGQHMWSKFGLLSMPSAVAWTI